MGRFTRGRRHAYLTPRLRRNAARELLYPVNNASRGNGAISAHLLLNVRFAAPTLPPPKPPLVASTLTAIFLAGATL